MQDNKSASIELVNKITSAKLQQLKEDCTDPGTQLNTSDRLSLIKNKEVNLNDLKESLDSVLGSVFSLDEFLDYLFDFSEHTKKSTFDSEDYQNTCLTICTEADRIKDAITTGLEPREIFRMIQELRQL